MVEEWRDIEFLKGRYAISSHGRVKILEQKFIRPSGLPLHIKERIITDLAWSRGYYFLQVYKPKRKNYTIHRLVALAFIPNPENKPFINHKDGCKTNNHFSNLEWCTPGENMRHSFATGLNKPIKGLPGEEAGNHKLTNEQVALIKSLPRKGNSNKAIGERFGVWETTISSIRCGKTWKHIHPASFSESK